MFITSSTRYSWPKLMKLEFSPVFPQNKKTSHFINVLPVGAELFHEDRRTDRHDEAKSRFSQFCERA
jgi:hypothetical protein